MKLMVLNGPNLNMLGIRQPEIYGRLTYGELCCYLENHGQRLGHVIDCCQSNSEGRLIDYLQQAYFEKYEGIIINPGAYTHYSYALYDALMGSPLPAVEVHLSDIYKREAFRRISVTAPACLAQIYGKGPEGYIEAMTILQQHCQRGGM